MVSRLLVGGEIVLYGDVGDYWGDGTGFTDREALEALAEVQGQDVTVRINSGGGAAWQGFAIYHGLRQHTGKVTIQIDALAASAASIIAMAGDEILIAPDAMIMIHDPSSIVWGNASAMRSAADRLDKLAERGAEIYARRSGRDAAEMRELMLAETWFSAEEAIAAGLATTLADGAGAEMSAFDYTLYTKVPELVRASQRARPLPVEGSAALDAPSQKTAATQAAKLNTEAMDDLMVTKPKEEAAPQPIEAPQQIAETTTDIFQRCEAAKLTMEETSAVIKNAGGDAMKARDMIIDTLAARDAAPEIQPYEPARVIQDATDKFKAGVEKSLMAKAGLEGGEHNEFTSFSLKELARESLMVVGRRNDARMADAQAMIGAAFMSSGLHSTSDFVHILANVANKSMLKGYEEAEETFAAWTAKGVLTDFKPVKRVDIGLFPSLTEIPEGAEYNHATVGDRGESIQLATYGKLFAITRQAIINDDLSAFTRVPQRMGRAAHRTIGNMVYAILNDNPTMSDTKALFHADHGNLASAGAALSVTSLDAGRAAMALQTDADEIATALNIRPRHLLVPVSLEGTAKALMASEFDPSKTQRAPNIVQGLAQVVSDARLTGTAWYLAADANTYDTIEVAYLNGNSNPVLERQDGWKVDGVEFKVRIDAGVKATGYQGLYKNGGA